MALRADAQARREQILSRTRELIIREGLNHSMRTFARNAGVGIATLLRHFPRRVDLINAVARENVDRLAEIVSKVDPTWEENPAAAWQELVEKLLELGMNGGLGEAVAAAENDQEIASDPGFQALRQEIMQHIGPQLTRAVAAGFLPAQVTPTQFFIGLMVVSRPLAADVENLVPGFGKWLVATYLAGLARQAQA